MCLEFPFSTRCGYCARNPSSTRLFGNTVVSSSKAMIHCQIVSFIQVCFHSALLLSLLMLCLSLFDDLHRANGGSFEVTASQHQDVSVSKVRTDLAVWEAPAESSDVFMVKQFQTPAIQQSLQFSSLIPTWSEPDAGKISLTWIKTRTPIILRSTFIINLQKNHAHKFHNWLGEAEFNKE